uniref:Uncharacterized protein n=1 Tax=Zonotrichia albicollis TaxID=44394 RepID=A0A8D2MPZ3_ZONAL
TRLKHNEPTHAVRSRFLQDKAECEQQFQRRMQQLTWGAQEVAMKALIQHVEEVKAENRLLRHELMGLLQHCQLLRDTRVRLQDQKEELLRENLCLQLMPARMASSNPSIPKSLIPKPTCCRHSIPKSQGHKISASQNPSIPKSQHPKIPASQNPRSCRHSIPKPHHPQIPKSQVLQTQHPKIPASPNPSIPKSQLLQTQHPQIPHPSCQGHKLESLGWNISRAVMENPRTVFGSKFLH